jgi:hypothetical protein
MREITLYVAKQKLIDRSYLHPVYIFYQGLCLCV